MSWISVKDRLPKKDERVLIRIDKIPYQDSTRNLIIIACYSTFVDEDVWWPDSQFAGYDGVEDISPMFVTHWMPLPEPPVSV